MRAKALKMMKLSSLFLAVFLALPGSAKSQTPVSVNDASFD
jgi:hypothetical protein